MPDRNTVMAMQSSDELKGRVSRHGSKFNHGARSPPTAREAAPSGLRSAHQSRLGSSALSASIASMSSIKARRVRLDLPPPEPGTQNSTFAQAGSSPPL